MVEPVCNGRATILPSLEVVKKVIKPARNEHQNLNWLIHIHYTRQNYKLCRKLIEQQLMDSYNAEYLYFVKGLIEKEEENYLEALKNFQKAIDLNTNNLEIYKEIGKTLYKMGRYKQAMGIFRETEKMSTRPDADIFHFIGELLYKSIQENKIPITSSSTILNDVKEYFLKSIQCGKKLESYQKLAEIYRSERDYVKAIEILESSLQIVPENTEILTEIGVLYLKVNDTQRAFDKLLEVTDINKNCPKGLIAFGAILQSRNDIDGALGKYKEIAGDALESPELWNNIGLCFFKKKKLIVAIACLRKSIWLSPLNYNSLYNLSLVFITANQFASAFHTLAAAINLRKDSAECYMLLGICLRKLEDYENAYTAFDRAIQLPDALRNPLIHLNFALFCYETERIDLAVVNFNNFIKVSKSYVLPTEYKFHATKLKALLQTYDDKFQKLTNNNDKDEFDEMEKSVSPEVRIKTSENDKNSESSLSFSQNENQSTNQNENNDEISRKIESGTESDLV